MSQTQKRKMEIDPPNYEDIAEKYKEKLITLARAYAELLNTIESYASVQSSSNNNNIKRNSSKRHSQHSRNDSIEEDDNAVVDEEEDGLLCCSQLDDDYKYSQEEESPTCDFTMPLGILEITKSDVSVDGYGSGNLERYESVASQKSTFSTFIEGCGTDLGPIPELEGLLNLDSITIIPQPLLQDQIDDESETDTLLVTNLSQFPCHVRVGVGVFIKDPKNASNIFAGIRKNSHGDGTLALPGGHLEMGESWEQCAKREVKEETGLLIHNIKFIHATNDIFTANKHYVTIFMSAECCDTKSMPKNLEPHKCQGWNSYLWTEIDEIASGSKKDLKLFGPLLNLVQKNPNHVLQFLNSACK